MHKTVLTIAGSDPTGGAGIQADLKTMTALGVYGAAVITCITVQNSLGVSRVEPLHPVLVGEQIEAVLADHLVSHVKIGMVGTASIARIIARKLLGFRGEVIYDPVLTATTGQQLTLASDLEAVRTELLPVTTVLTPNLPELERLTEMPGDGPEKIPDGIASLFAMSNRLRAVLVKGGHSDSCTMITDTLYCKGDFGMTAESLSHAFLQTMNSHGTGCTLASAFAAFLSQGHDDSSAFRQAVFFVQKLLRHSLPAQIVNNPKGKGGLLHHLARHSAAE